MSTADLIHEIEALPQEQRAKAVKAMLKAVYHQNDRTIERLLRRLEHPEIPDDVWAGLEEAEDGQAIEMKDEHFDNPPV